MKVKCMNVKDQSCKTGLSINTKLSSFNMYLLMYKYILFKSFGEVFSSNTTSVVKENSCGTFL